MAVSEKDKEYIRNFRKTKSARQVARELGLSRVQVIKTLKELEDKGRSKKKQTPPVELSEEKTVFSRKDYYWAAGTAVFSLVVLLLTAAPDITGEDSGELVTAAYTLGVAHPPGYPLWCILGKLFTILVPVGTIAYRLSFMSAFFAAGTVFFLFLVIRKLTGNRVIAASASLVFAFSYESWSQSNIAEVYTLNSCFIGACLFLLLMWEERRSNRLLYILAFLCGLGCTNHHTMAPLSAAFAFYVFYKSRRRPVAAKVWGIGTLLFAGALSVYLYLPIRGRADPYINWGKPATLGKAAAHVLRRQYKIPSFVVDAGPEYEWTIKRFGKQIGVYAGAFVRQFTWLLFWLPILGLWLHYRGRRFEFYFLLSIFVLTSLGFIIFSNFKPEREGIIGNDFLFIPSYMVATLWLSIALLYLWKQLKRKLDWRHLPVAAAAAALLLPLPNLLSNYRELDKSNYYYALDYGRAIFETMDEDAIVFPHGDHRIFPLLYLQGVLGQRPDVTLAVKYGHIERALYPELIERAKRAGMDARRIPRREVERHIIRKNRDRPMYLTESRAMDDLPGLTWVPEGLLLRVVREADLPDYRKKVSEDYWKRYRLRNLTDTGAARDYSADMILVDYHYMRALSYLEEGRNDKALAEIDKLKEPAQHFKEVLNNTGNMLARRGLLRQAIEFYKQALTIKPDFLTVNLNMAKAYLLLKDYENCSRYLDRALELAPDNAEALDLKSRIRGK